MKKENKVLITTRVIVYSAVLAALAAVVGQLLAFRPTEYMKFTLDKFILFLSGMFFGPVVGGMTGFVAEFAGGNLLGRGFTLWLCLPAVLYGVAGGLFRGMLAKKFTIPRLALAYFIPTFAGAFLIQSVALSLTYPMGTFAETLSINLLWRGIQFSIMMVVEVAIIYFIIRSNIFARAGLWPPKATAEAVAQPVMTAEQAIAYIESVSWKGSRPGLERVRELLDRMGCPEKQLKYVHIAGTNGKGSTAAMTASILRKAGYRTGLYTSPHIFRFHERVQIDGVEISDEDLAAVTEYVRPFAQAMADHPTEFELVFCIAIEYFRRKACDIVVLEVGMGGAMDATNTIPVPEVAVITNIGLDHTGFLGNTVEEIATEKCGIFKDGGSAVVYRSTPGVEEVFEKAAAAHNMSLKKADFDSLEPVSHSLEGQIFHCGSRRNLQLPLLGAHQLHNASVVLSIADTLMEKGWHITEENIRSGLLDVSWPGRFHIVKRDPLFIVDGGHNPQCLESLVQNILDYLPGRQIIALTGVLADKDYGEMYRPVMPYISKFVCITPPNDRKLEARELEAHLRAAGADAVAADSITCGVQTAQELAGKEGVVLCFGSLYSIGTIYKAL